MARLVAARHPEGLKGLILYAPAPPTPLDVPEDVRRGYIDLYQSREGAELVIRNLTPHPLSDAFREQIIEDTLRGSSGAKRARPEKGMSADISDEASRIAVPVHVIVGGDDRVETEASLRAAFGKVLEGVNFVVIPGVGHIAPLGAPAKLASAIRSVSSCKKRFCHREHGDGDQDGQQNVLHRSGLHRACGGHSPQRPPVDIVHREDQGGEHQLDQSATGTRTSRPGWRSLLRSRALRTTLGS